jgi:hypothetical protein
MRRQSAVNNLSRGQTDKAVPSEGRGHRFESCRARHFSTTPEQNWALPFTAYVVAFKVAPTAN